MQAIGIVTICLKLQYCMLESPMIRREDGHLIAALGLWKKAAKAHTHSKLPLPQCFKYAAYNSKIQQL